jgi:hypothetical protein
MKPSNLLDRSKRIAARTALAAGLVLSLVAFAPLSGTSAFAQESAPAQAASPQAEAPAGQNQNAQSPITDEWRQVLQGAGTFINHARYGEVWKPTVTPESWHPYPACYWKFTKKFGWYFDDPSEWGKIVHHYGRWTNDTEHGWIWVPGAEFSPGWVVWRTSDRFIGWAPQMPDQDIREVTTEQFNKSGQWIFMDAKKFGKNCKDVLPVAQQPYYLQQTKYVRDIKFVEGIGVLVLPSIFTGPYVDIVVEFNPWSVHFVTSWIVNINWFWNHIVIVINLPCPRPVRPIAQPVPPPPPPPKPLVVDDFCKRNPLHTRCDKRPLCEKYPRHWSCRKPPVTDPRPFCEKFPRHPRCRPNVDKRPFCVKYPRHPRCRTNVDRRPFCVKYPNSRRCKGHNAGGRRPHVWPHIRPHVRPHVRPHGRPHVRPHRNIRPRWNARPQRFQQRFHAPRQRFQAPRHRFRPMRTRGHGRRF